MGLRRLLLALPLALALAACIPGEPTATLRPGRALVGEAVEAILTGASAEGARVAVGGEPAEVVSASGERVVFRVPELPGGPKPVEIQTSRGVARATLEVLGQVDRSRILLRLPLGETPKLPPEFRLLETTPLTGCGYTLAVLGYSGEALGQALEELEALDPDYKADPESLWSLGGWSGGEAIGAPQAHARGHKGRGVQVAVLDTGVDGSVPQGPGYDFVEDDPTPQDAFPGGHGTQAANLVREVAPEAAILPVRVCDEGGTCRSSWVVKGVCWVVENAKGPTVLNLSLGGDTPVGALKLALQAALAQDIPVAAAAGNQGAQGSPAHYPAAFDLPGLVAVGALQEDLSPAPFSTRGAYVDLAAPGAGLPCIGPNGPTTCNGTSFAAPLVAGAMALWLEAQPGLPPAQLQQDLEDYARPLPYPSQAVGKGMVDLSQKP
ncbi:S8 family peptidase [Thermus oshimai]|uniref:S8 family peptidase n=1 Tax=Thermus oshimai TaxID=56957 RepID=UPI000361651F|nr:S8 family serine peptidase [Thermus oshimai]